MRITKFKNPKIKFINMYLLEKYKPKKISEMIDNKKPAEEVLRLVKNYKKGKAIMLYGPPGCGKTLSVEIIAQELNYELVRLTAADFRSYTQLKKTILQSSLQASLRFKGKILLVDELEFVFDPGMKRGLKELIKESPFPVILISQNPYIQQLKEIRQMCKLIKFDRVKWTSIRNLLEKIARKERIKYEKSALDQLARMANGDVRAALIDLGSLLEVTTKSLQTLGDRAQEQSIFDTLKVLFKTKDLENALLALDQAEKTPEEIFWWLEENIFREYEKPEDIARGYEYIAFADFFKNQITKRQAWNLQKYFLDGILFVSIAKTSVYRKFVKYHPPTFFSQIKTQITKELEGILEKIGKQTHTSKQRAMDYLPLIKILIEKRKGLSFLDESEMELLRHAKLPKGV